jgi:hypothetical protein
MVAWLKLASSIVVTASLVVACGNHAGGTPRDAAPAGDGGAGDGAGGDGGCGLQTCMSQQAMCGPIGDGCGGMIDCGGCPTGETCGGGGVLFTCGSASGGVDAGVCTKRTCQQAGAQCGVVPDNCGGVTADCGPCPTGEVCGAGGVPNQCGGPPCVGLCGQQAACNGMPKTTISGTVTAPGHTNVGLWGNPDPVYGALVYVPNGAAGPPGYGVTAFPSGVACDSCSSLVSGDPLVSVVTGVDGKFTLPNAPCGTNIPLVIQLGRWRRQITIPSVACCADTALTNTQTHLPRNHTGETGDLRSDIPLMAFSTGNVDTLHCVLRKIGVEDGEFSDPSGTGRVRFYADNGAVISATTPAAGALYGSAAELAKYDMALFECVGNKAPKQAADQQRLIDFADAGGRVFATHFSYVWLTNSDGMTAASNTAPKPWFQTASWFVDQGSFTSATGLVDQTLQGDPATQTRRKAFASWLTQVGASTTPGQIPVNVVRNDFTAVSAAPATKAGTPAQQWLYSSGQPFTGPLHYTFDTPVSYAPDPAPTKQCGRVLYSDFHVSDAVSGGIKFPAECTDGKMNAQEKTLEFMLFDLASCVGPPLGACTPRTCQDFGYTCGQSGDGCADGVILNCGTGTCPQGQTCGGGGLNVCGGNICTPRTCLSAGAQCGIIGNGCNGTVDCGGCPTNQTCGGGGIANQCGGTLF